MRRATGQGFVGKVKRYLLASIAVGLLGSVFVSGFPSGQTPSAKETTPPKPNVIYILADDLGYGDLGSYGQTKIQTPHLDQLAEEGVQFTQHYAGSPVCAPSRYTLMTGKHTGHASRRANRPYIPLRSDDATVAEVLKPAGYRTGIIGKWGLADTPGDYDPGTMGKPTQRGFDYFFGFLNQKHAWNYYPNFVWENGDKYELNGDKYIQDVFTTKALQFIRQNREGPFYLSLEYTIPHVNNALGHTPYNLPIPCNAPYRDKGWPHIEKNYAAMVTRLDRDVGKIMQLLREQGIADNTIIMFSSDNGAQNYSPHDKDFFQSTGGLRSYKGRVYEGGIRVPLIVRWPEVVQRGTESDHISAMWDILPTLADVAGAKKPDGIDGISFLPALRGESQKKHNYLYWEFPAHGYQQAIRQGKWKAIRHGGRGGTIELYNLEEDVQEEHNVSAAYPRRVDKFRKLFTNARTKSEHWPLPTAD